MNLGHTLRKLRQWEPAIDCYLQALGLKPGQVRPPGAGHQSAGSSSGAGGGAGAVCRLFAGCMQAVCRLWAGCGQAVCGLCAAQAVPTLC